MKIDVNKPTPETLPVRKLAFGTTFKSGTKYYLKVENNYSDQYQDDEEYMWCVCLDENALTYFSGDADVQPVKAKVVIE